MANRLQLVAETTMDLERYLLFVGASIVLCAVPGPDMVLLLGRSIAQGRRAGVTTALGINLGAYVHLLAAVAGISAAIASSAYAFTVIKWVGAGYLIYLGVMTLRSKDGPVRISADGHRGLSRWSSFRQGFWSNVLNPKVAVFYLAILPQFVNPAEPSLFQLLVLGATLNIIGILSSLLIVHFSTALTERLRQDARASAWLTRALGTVFIALGVRLAGEKAL